MVARPIRTFEEIVPQYSLRPYQKQAVNQILQDLELHRRVLLHAPTGSGKTRMAMSVISMYFRRRGPTMVLWLAPTKELVVQAAQEFATGWRHQGDVPGVVIQWRGGGEGFEYGTTIKRNTLLVASVQMALERVRGSTWIETSLHEKVGLVVFDEAHQSLAPSYHRLVSNVVLAAGRSRALLGLSATPGRANPEESRALVEMYGGHKVNIGDGSNPVLFLQDQGYLAKPIFVRHTCVSTVEPLSSDQEYTNDTYTKLGNMTERNDQVVDVVVKLLSEGLKRIICFTPSVESAELCADLVRCRGYKYSVALSGQSSKADRDHYVGTFCVPVAKIPSPQVMFNCNVLTTGFDAPEIDATVICRPTKSAVLMQQMIGRALRGPKSGGTKIAQIHSLVDEQFLDFSNLVDLFREWDRLWALK